MHIVQLVAWVGVGERLHFGQCIGFIWWFLGFKRRLSCILRNVGGSKDTWQRDIQTMSRFYHNTPVGCILSLVTNPLEVITQLFKNTGKVIIDSTISSPSCICDKCTRTGARVACHGMGKCMLYEAALRGECL